MPLSNVWTRDASGEWVRTTAFEADRRYDHTVSVYGHQFRCYSCFQYVTFVKGDYKVSHFRHGKEYQDKECEDRSANARARYLHLTMSDMAMPLRLRIEGRRLIFSIGLLPISEAELDRCMACGMQVELRGRRGGPSVYKVDSSRFAPHATTWLDVPSSFMDGLRIAFSPKQEVPPVWSGEVPVLSESGALFDEVTGKRIPDRGDVHVGRKYLLMLGKNRWLDTSPSSMQISELAVIDGRWRVYSVLATRFADDAVDFFFNCRVRLTNYPVEMQVLWPPMFERDEVIETGFRNLQLIVKGEGDFAPYPKDACEYSSAKIRDGVQLIDLRNSGALQMVTSERYNQTLNFLYLCPMERTFHSEEPGVEIVDDDGRPCEDARLAKVPARGMLHLTPTDDGSVDVFDGEEFLYRKKLPAGVRSRITDLRANMRLRIRIGMELLRDVEIAPKPERAVQRLGGNSLPRWSGRMVPFPTRYAWILDRVDANSELYARIKSALRQGRIPRDGLIAIQRMMEGR